MPAPDLSPDLLVCGGGAAGISAGLSAARLGLRVALVEAGPRVGGTMAGALLHTLAGHYDSAGQLLGEGLIAELLDRLRRASGGATGQRRMGRVFVESVDPNLYREVVEGWLAEEPNVTVLTGTRVSAVAAKQRRVHSLRLDAHSGVSTIEPGAVVDASGEAAVFRALGSNHLLAAGPPVAAGFVVRLRGVDQKAVKFPRSVGLTRSVAEAVAQGSLPPECEGVWFDVGIFADEVFAKLAVRHPEDPSAAGRLAGAAERMRAFLRTVGGFEQAEITELGQIGIRENGRARGEYCLTEGDVRSGARFADVAARCAWPIEHWDAERGLTLDYLGDGVSYDIPLRALKAAGVDNLWAAGKCLSAEPRAQASARCVGTCWAMGEAVGQASRDYLAVRSNQRS